jgi:hypothetical protein
LSRLNWRRINDEKRIREQGSERLEPKPPRSPSKPWAPVKSLAGSSLCPAGCGRNIAVEYLVSQLARCSPKTAKLSQATVRQRVRQKRCSSCGVLVNENRLPGHARRCSWSAFLRTEEELTISLRDTSTTTRGSTHTTCARPSAVAGPVLSCRLRRMNPVKS